MVKFIPFFIFFHTIYGRAIAYINQPSYVNGRINAHYIPQIISFVLRSYSIWFNNNSITMYCVYRW